jgi:hypothetical protein
MRYPQRKSACGVPFPSFGVRHRAVRIADQTVPERLGCSRRDDGIPERPFAAAQAGSVLCSYFRKAIDAALAVPYLKAVGLPGLAGGLEQRTGLGHKRFIFGGVEEFNALNAPIAKEKAAHGPPRVSLPLKENETNGAQYGGIAVICDAIGAAKTL